MACRGVVPGQYAALAQEKFGVRCYLEHDESSDEPPGVDGFVAALRRADVVEWRVVGPQVNARVAAAEVTLLNQNARLRGAYEFFRWQCQAFLNGHKDASERRSVDKMPVRVHDHGISRQPR